MKNKQRLRSILTNTVDGRTITQYRIYRVSVNLYLLLLVIDFFCFSSMSICIMYEKTVVCLCRWDYSRCLGLLLNNSDDVRDLVMKRFITYDDVFALVTHSRSVVDAPESCGLLRRTPGKGTSRSCCR